MTDLIRKNPIVNSIGQTATDMLSRRYHQECIDQTNKVIKIVEEYKEMSPSEISPRTEAAWDTILDLWAIYFKELENPIVKSRISIASNEDIYQKYWLWCNSTIFEFEIFLDIRRSQYFEYQRLQKIKNDFSQVKNMTLES